MRFDIITIFPEALPYLDQSIIKRAAQKGLIQIYIHNLRNFTDDKRRTVDDRPYGGGAGMVLKVEPMYKSVNHILNKTKKIKSEKRRIILLSAKGSKFSQKKAKALVKYKHLILICGHYEGVDERVAKYIADEELSIGNYVLTGGELAAMVVLDAAVRNIKGVINEKSLKDESFNVDKSDKKIMIEHPHYTRPEVFKPKKMIKSDKNQEKWTVPKVLLGGNHAEIENWGKNHRKKLPE